VKEFKTTIRFTAEEWEILQRIVKTKQWTATVAVVNGLRLLARKEKIGGAK
jgi:hypothetical protein